MGSESNSATVTTTTTATSTSARASTSTSTTQSPSGKRSRDPDDEVYLDNFHNHKRYLSEIMASSLNGLKVEDQLPENLMDSSARPEGMFYTRDDISLQYSPMSEDSDDSRYSELPTGICSFQPDSVPSSPVSPCRLQRLSGLATAPSSSSYPLHSCSVAAVTSSHHRSRGSDSEGRFPSSPSDICHSGDLRRAALLRSVQMRTQPPGQSTIELPFAAGQESSGSMETEEQQCSYMKSFVEEREYPIEECPNTNISEPGFNQEKPCRELDMNLNMKEDNPGLDH